ncbi:flavin reductase family protein [Ferroacidibacillus organovorans]|uniref:Flavin reductase like domain-containing protein n=1 Tax=Ferroacidibacillus organovorans TaxID=1765683 RepID=A0A162UHL4_9BACL|nr:flavin reductase family protein [Ferroacidibacillus organovorans]KYP81764.1 hypothetical protein AYJ22_05885 [Ferroacidibacillus organovorans]OAG93304.1 hypothetical protein AYW79_11360 [Ferroacidibacillus organovorans]OPG16102.1 hypothetical protein B2M26_08650 [Ferroacidibacillus organovorans]
MAIDAQTFRASLGRFASGVTVVTTSHGEQRAGLTVSAFSSVSLEPPLILVCIDKRSSAIDQIDASQVFAVHILSEAQVDLSNRFASRSEDKFAGLDFEKSAFGNPKLPDALVFLDCRVSQKIDAGDHFIYVGLIEEAEVAEEKQPLVYFSGGYRSLME